MKYLKKHNEIFGFFKKDSKEKESEIKSSKDSMWIINPKLKLIEPSENIYKYHVDIVDEIKGGFNINSLSKKEFNRWYNQDTALWLKDKPYNRSGRMVSVSSSLEYIREGGKLFDFKKYFKKLQDTSKELGYTIGTSVYVKEFDKVGKIESLRESCICTIRPLSNDDDIPDVANILLGDIKNLALTIYYKVNVPGESHTYEFYYNISQIEKIDQQEKLPIDPNYVSDFFIDLIDNESIKLDIEVLQDQNGDYLLCRISYIDRIQPIFNELMENYLRLSQAMSIENNFITEITNISMSNISFKMKQNKKEG